MLKVIKNLALSVVVCVGAAIALVIELALAILLFCIVIPLKVFSSVVFKAYFEQKKASEKQKPKNKLH